MFRIVPIAKYIIIWRKKTITSRQKTKGAINEKRNKITKIRKIKQSAKALQFFWLQESFASIKMDPSNDNNVNDNLIRGIEGIIYISITYGEINIRYIGQIKIPIIPYLSHVFRTDFENVLKRL